MSVAKAVAATSRRFKRFPPGTGNLLVPVDSRTAAMAAIALWPACRSTAVWARRLARTAVAIAGPRALPGRARTWTPPPGQDVWDRLVDRWSEVVGSVASWSVYQRPQTERDGFAVLLIEQGRPRGFAKVRAAADPIAREWRALKAARGARTGAFEVPEPLATGEEDGWHWWLSRSLPVGLHTPPRDPPLEAITAEIHEALAGFPRPEGTPDHWSPIHGDLTPWNLRESSGRLVLVDWEDAGWGPPRADEVLYRAVVAALGGERRRVPDAREAIEYWRRDTTDAGADRRDRRLSRGIGEALSWMAARS